MKYINTSHIVIRVPLYPEFYIHKALSDEQFFKNIISSNDFRISMFITSPSLSAEQDKYLEWNLKETEILRIKRTFMKYIARMSTRCTPFGTLASCATIEIGNENCIRISDKLQINCRLDMHCLCAISHFLQNSNKIKQFVQYTTNSTLYKVGKYYRYIQCQITQNGRYYTIEQVKRSKLLDYVLSVCSKFISYEDILSNLTSEYEISITEAKKYLDLLIESQILVSECDPMISGEDYFHYLQEKVINCGNDNIINSLAEISNELSAIEREWQFDQFSKRFHTIANIVGSYGIKYDKKFLLQVDSIRKVENNVISNKLIDQINKCLVLLDKITPRFNDTNLTDFINRFVNRYGDMEIGLLEALDPNIGIGYITKQDNTPNTLIAGLALPHKIDQLRQLKLTPLTAILLKKIYEFNPETDNSIEITDYDVKDLKENINDLPLSMAAFFRVLNINYDNSYQIADLHFSGTSAANMLARFAYGDSTIESIVNTITISEQEAVGNDVILAEIVHLPEARTGNVLFRPHIREYEITYLTNSTLNTSNIIPINDLYVSVKNNMVILRSKSLGKKVIPRLTTAHNFKGDVSPIYRFLCDLQSQGYRNSLYFSWCGLEYVYERLPRVTYESIILSPAKWSLTKEQFMLSQNIDINAVRIWRNRKKIPQYVNLVVGDNKLFIDLDNTTSIEIFFKEVTKLNQFTLEEYLPSTGIVTDYDGNNYNNEFIIPYIKL